MKYGIGRFIDQKQDHYTANFERLFRQIERKTGIRTILPKKSGGKQNTKPTRYCYLNKDLKNNPK